MRIYIFLLLLIYFLASCTRKNTKNQSDYWFYIQEANVCVTTSKRMDGTFYLMFQKSNGLAILSDSIDYICFNIEECPVNIIIDPSEKLCIYVLDEYSNVKKWNSVNYKIERIGYQTYKELFFEEQYKTSPLQIRSPYIQMDISSMQYAITVNNKIIKEADMYGGW
jgi:hypothetical protein